MDSWDGRAEGRRSIGCELARPIGAGNRQHSGGPGASGSIRPPRHPADSPEPLVEPPAMPRPRTLFTGQWADMPLAVLAEKAARWGYDGLELACWGDHFEVDRALAEDDYCQG